MVKPNDPKFRELLEKIDPSFRLQRLKAELEGGEPTGQGGATTGLRHQFVEAHAQAQAQSRLLALHEGQPAPNPEIHKQRVELAKENERIAWLMAEYFGNELARVLQQIEEFTVVGLPPAELSTNGDRANRAVRRAKS